MENLVHHPLVDIIWLYHSKLVDCEFVISRVQVDSSSMVVRHKLLEDAGL